MDNRNKVVELLKNYRYYKQAIRGYWRRSSDEMITDRYMSAAPCRTAIYSDTPIGRGSGSRIPTLTGSWSLLDEIEYKEYTYIVDRIDQALDTLTDDERSVVTQKWVNGLTLKEIGERKNYSEAWAKKIHRRAIQNMEICLRFDHAPRVDRVPVA